MEENGMCSFFETSVNGIVMFANIMTFYSTRVLKDILVLQVLHRSADNIFVYVRKLNHLQSNYSMIL